MKYILYVFLYMALCSCKQNVNPVVQEFIHSKIEIPSSSLCGNFYSAYADTTLSKNFRLVKFVSSDECTSCKLNAIVHEEKLSRSHELYRMVDEIYIVSTLSRNFEKVV